MSELKLQISQDTGQTNEQFYPDMGSHLMLDFHDIDNFDL